MTELYRIINFKRNCGSCGGSLVQFQPGDEPENALPFSIGKVLVSSGMQPDHVRGNHAHYETEEIIVALSGGCTFELDDGRGTRVRVRLGVGECGSEGVEEDRSQTSDVNELTPNLKPQTSNLDPSTSNLKPQTSNREEIKALLLFPRVWRSFHDFEPNTVLLVVASMMYDESDYIRERSEFERLAQTWDTLGGSAER